MSTRNIVNDAVRIAILGAAIPLTIGVAFIILSFFNKNRD